MALALELSPLEAMKRRVAQLSPKPMLREIMEDRLQWMAEENRERDRRASQQQAAAMQDYLENIPVMGMLGRNKAFGLGFDGDLSSVAQIVRDQARPIPEKPTTAMLETIAPDLADETNERVALALEVEDLLGYTALRKDVKAPSKLHRALTALEIDVYSDETVEQYKVKMRAHFQAAADKRDRERIQQTRGAFGTTTQTVVTWRMVELERYTKPVPEHVLRKCVQIRRAMPEAKFRVDELVEETRTLDPFMVVTLGNDRAVIEVWDEPEFDAEFAS